MQMMKRMVTDNEKVPIDVGPIWRSLVRFRFHWLTGLHSVGGIFALPEESSRADADSGGAGIETHLL
jgi:hypothetical protein